MSVLFIFLGVIIGTFLVCFLLAVVKVNKQKKLLEKGIDITSNASNKPASVQNPVKYFKWFVIILVAVVGLLLVVSERTNPSTATFSNKITDSYGHDEFDANVIAERIVSSELKSPSTAKFCKESECTISVDNKTWTVSGWVDAQNSFGATLRSNYTVKFTFTSEENYTIDMCNIK